jgi:hypothetical protein
MHFQNKDLLFPGVSCSLKMFVNIIISPATISPTQKKGNLMISTYLLQKSGSRGEDES